MQSSGDSASSKAPKHAQLGCKWFACYVFGTAVLGLLVGFLAGLSQSPVIGTLLPLIFGLVGGSSALLIAREDLRSPLGVERLSLIGILTIAFALPCLLSAIYAVAVRTGTGLSGFVPRWEDTPRLAPLPTEGATASDMVDLAILRLKMQMAGMTVAEQQVLLAAAAKDVSTPVDPKVTEELLGQLKAISQGLAESLAKAAAKHPEWEEYRIRFKNLAQWAENFVRANDASRFAKGTEWERERLKIEILQNTDFVVPTYSQGPNWRDAPDVAVQWSKLQEFATLIRSHIGNRAWRAYESQVAELHRVLDLRARLTSASKTERPDNPYTGFSEDWRRPR